MDCEDKSMTAIILRLLQEGLIMFSTCLKTGALTPILTQKGRMIGEVLSSLIDEYTSKANWDALCKASSWKEVVMVVLGIAANWAVKNVELMMQLALRIARFIDNLYKNSESAHSNSFYRPLPTQENES